MSISGYLDRLERAETAARALLPTFGGLSPGGDVAQCEIVGMAVEDAKKALAHARSGASPRMRDDATPGP